jgi:hypothetical protein
VGTAASVYPCKAEDILTEAKRNLIINELMPTAINWLKTSLSVRPIVGNLKITSAIPSQFCYSGDDRFGFTCCQDQVNPLHINPGIPNADYVAHVTARPFRGAVVAWAYPCVEDSIGRPISGQINFVPSSVSTDPSESRMQFIKTLHELFHNLGFSSDFFPRYLKPGTTSSVGAGGATKSMFSTELQKTINTFVMANAVAKQSEHFNCHTWESNWGVELEDNGGGGTAGKHLEERVYFNELMSGWVHENTVPSAISLAFLEDSGWYKVSYELAEKLVWGANEGCAFAQQRCNKWNSRYFCTTPSQSGCTPDLRSKASCNAYDVSPNAPEFESRYQYFPDFPRRAGNFEGADYCPVFYANKNGDCTSSSTPKYWFYAEYTGVGSRCFMGTYQVAQATFPLERHGGCAYSECDPLTNRIRVTLGKGQPKEVTFLCPLSGGDVDLSLVDAANWKGIFECPPSAVLCSGSPCDVQDCNGHGTCRDTDGSCQCNTGYFGDVDTATNLILRCDKQFCPKNPTSGEECSGSGVCDRSTGVCTDVDGFPGCFPGFKGADCSEVGCPKGASPSCPDPFVPCECSGRGTCQNGTCACQDGYIASDCGLTDCPKSLLNGNLRCSGGSQGACDVTSGICECTEGVSLQGQGFHYRDADCSTLVPSLREYTTLYFSGEPIVNSTAMGAPVLVAAAAKAYKYFEFDVPSVKYDLKLVARRATGQPNNLRVPRLFAGYASNGVPSTTNFQFQSTLTSSGSQEIVFHSDAGSAMQNDPNGQTPSVFSDIGTMRVAVVGQDPVEVDLELTRDVCATTTCSTYGSASSVCTSNGCSCKRRVELTSFSNRQYGFTGLDCSVPDCPGSPDCGGKAGRCVFKPGMEWPECECSILYTGESCQTRKREFAGRTLSPTASIAMRGSYTRPGTDGVQDVRVDYFNSTLGPVRLGVGALSDVAVVDLRTASGADAIFQQGAASYFVRMTVRGDTNGGVEAPENSDPALLVQINDGATFSSYLNFDRASWENQAAVHELSGTFSSEDNLIVTVSNGKYAIDPIDVDIFVEISTQGCPPTLNQCSGHAAGPCITECQCEQGYVGSRCAMFAAPLLAGSVAPVIELQPAAWSYFTYNIADGTQEVEIKLTPAALSSPRSYPKLLAVFDTGMSAASIRKLRTSAAAFDYWHSGNSSAVQTITMERSSPSSQRYVIIGVQNLDHASAAVSLDVSLTARKSSSLPDCSTASRPPSCSQLRALCNYHGEYSFNRQVPFCDCDPGWDPATRCAAPRFASANEISNAAQQVEYICSECSKEIRLEKDQIFIFKSPEPVQVGASLKVTVNALDASGLPYNSTFTASGARRLVASSVGNPSVLVASKLPKTLSDFETIVSTRETSVQATMSSGSRSSKYYIAVYANQGGNFSITMERSEVKYVAPIQVSFVQRVYDWVFGTARGLIVFFLGLALVLSLIGCCLFDLLAPRCCARCIAGRDRMADSMDAELAEELKSYKKTLSERSTRSFTRASERVLAHRQAASASTMPRPPQAPPKAKMPPRTQSQPEHLKPLQRAQLPRVLAAQPQPVLGTMAMLSHPEFRGGYVIGGQFAPGMVMMGAHPSMAMMPVSGGVSPHGTGATEFVDSSDIPDLDHILDQAEEVELHDDDIPEEPEGEAPTHAFVV